MPNVEDTVKFHFVHTHKSRVVQLTDEIGPKVTVHDPVWRTRDAKVIAIRGPAINEPLTLDLSVLFMPEDFDDGSSPAAVQTHVPKLDGEVDENGNPKSENDSGTWTER